MTPSKKKLFNIRIIFASAKEKVYRKDNIFKATDCQESPEVDKLKIDKFSTLIEWFST
jgi:hypothetical protein